MKINKAKCPFGSENKNSLALRGKKGKKNDKTSFTHFPNYFLICLLETRRIIFSILKMKTLNQLKMIQKQTCS